MKSIVRLFAGCAMFVGLLPPPAANAQIYPSRPVRILYGNPAGGPGEVVARGIAQGLSQALGQPVVVENRAGADGMIAGEACARSAPDGYTLCMSDSLSVVLNPLIRAQMPYDPVRDLAPIVHLGYLGVAVLVNPSVPANTLRELFELVKAKPGSISWGSSGRASSPNIYMGWLKNAKGISFYNVPYKGASQIWQAMLAGEVQVAQFSIGLAVPSVKAGKARALFVSTRRRSSLLPDVPTHIEAGMDISLGAWFGLFASTGTSNEVVQRLNAEVAHGLINNANLREKFLTSIGIETEAPAGASPDAFAAFLKDERDRYASIAKIAGVKVE